MKPVSGLSLLLIYIFLLEGCAPVSSTIQPTQVVQYPSLTTITATGAVTQNSTPSLSASETSSPTEIHIPFVTLEPQSVNETMQPLIKNPMDCSVPCFLGITPGKTSIDDARTFFGTLGLVHREGTDPNSGKEFYSVGYDSIVGHNSDLTLYVSNSVVDSIEVVPEISKQQEGSPREWIAYSPETFIKKYGAPSRVDVSLAWPGGGGSEIIMNLYFDSVDLIVQYTGQNMVPSNNHSPRLCPLTAPFDYVRLWLGPNPPNPPQLPSIALEKASSLTIDQFTQLMLGDPQNACFTLNGDAFN
jgi:hypothetical protein